MTKYNLTQLESLIQNLQDNFIAVNDQVLTSEILDGIKKVLSETNTPLFVKEKASGKLFMLLRNESEVLFIPITEQEKDILGEQIKHFYAQIDPKTKILFANEYGLVEFKQFINMLNTFMPVDYEAADQKYYKKVDGLDIQFQDYEVVYKNNNLAIEKSTNKENPVMQLVIKLDENTRYLIPVDMNEASEIVVKLGKIKADLVSVNAGKEDAIIDNLKQTLLDKIQEIDKALAPVSKTAQIPVNEETEIMTEEDPVMLTKPAGLFTKLGEK